MFKPDEQLENFRQNSQEIMNTANKVCDWLWNKHESSVENLTKDDTSYLMGAVMYIKAEMTSLLTLFANCYPAQVSSKKTANLIQRIDHCVSLISVECEDYEGVLKSTFGEFYRFCGAVEKCDIFFDEEIAMIYKERKNEQNQNKP